MHRTARTAIAGLIAATAMALAITAASANNLSISNKSVRLVWSALEFEAGESTLARCPVTLEGSLHESTIQKVEHTLLGYVTRAAIGTCASGHASILAATLPWHLRYMGFTGRLPFIASAILLLSGVGFRIESLGFFCLGLSSDTSPIDGIVSISEGGTITNVSPEPRSEIPLTSSGGFGCPSSSGHFKSNASTVTLLGATTAITIRLI